LQFDQHYVFGQTFKPTHAAVKLPGPVFHALLHAVDFEQKIGTRARAAKQDMTGFALGCGQGVFSVSAWVGLAVEYLALAYATNAGAATMGQSQADIKGGFEHGAISIGGESMATGLKLNLTGHNEIIPR
jgi:hypothetical protein